MPLPTRKGLVTNPADDFFQSDFSTPTEQADAIEFAVGPGGGTGIQGHLYTGYQGAGFDNDTISPLSLGSPLYEMNGGDYISARGRNPIFNYPPDALMDLLPAYKHSRHTNYLLEAYRDFLWSSEYFFYVISIPYNTESALITWKQTFRDQIDVPPKSFLIAIQGGAFSDSEEETVFNVPTSFRLQIYDDGAGEYLYNASLNTQICAGNDTPIANSGNAFGPFILPSPLSIVPSGMLVIQMTNTETSGTPGSATLGAIQAYVGLVFAVPKNTCLELKNATTGNRSI